jgi:hypothetical protein
VIFAPPFILHHLKCFEGIVVQFAQVLVVKSTGHRLLRLDHHVGVAEIAHGHTTQLVWAAGVVVVVVVVRACSNASTGRAPPSAATKKSQLVGEEKHG